MVVLPVEIRGSSIVCFHASIRTTMSQSHRSDGQDDSRQTNHDGSTSNFAERKRNRNRAIRTLCMQRSPGTVPLRACSWNQPIPRMLLNWSLGVLEILGIQLSPESKEPLREIHMEIPGDRWRSLAYLGDPWLRTIQANQLLMFPERTCQTKRLFNIQTRGY